MTLTAVLFAGGESRRMGVDKATLPVGGEPLWARQLKVLRILQPDALWVSARTRPAWCPAEIEVVLDEPRARGPLGGMGAVLKRMQTTHLLVLAVDLPRMNAAHLQNLWRHARPGCGVIPALGQDFEPLCAIYPGGGVALRAVVDALAGNDYSMRALVSTLVQGGWMTRYEVPPAERVHYGNANTPDEFAGMLQ